MTSRKPRLALFLFLLLTDLTLQSPPLRTILPGSDLSTPGGKIECFNLTTPNAYPVGLHDCPHAIELLYHDPTGVMSLQRFSRNRQQDTFPVPFAWQIGSCQVLLTSGADDAVDTFRLADVIVQAERIIETCPPMSKRRLGGIALVGSGQTFFVAVNGPDDSIEGDGGDGIVLLDEHLLREEVGRVS